MDPAALSKPDPESQASETPASFSGPLPNGNNITAKASKAPPATPRVDLEPFYTEIKAQIGDNWATYKDALSRFVLGGLNQVELSASVEPFIFVDPKRESLHNQLICGLYANILRDAPDTSVAPWVSANDKPTAAPKPASGDAVEQRLKQEIMQLPARMRHRIKAIRDDPSKPLTTTLHATARALSLPTTSPSLTTPHSAIDPTTTGATGLNRDLEIRRRYNLPLISELHELPSAATLHDRVLPICYEEGLGNGIAAPESVAALLETALGIFAKDWITGMMRRTRCDVPSSDPPLDINISAAGDGATLPPGEVGGWPGLDRGAGGLGIQTGSYKRKRAEEELASQRGELKRTEGGLLPVELEMARELGKGRAAQGDVALAWELGDETLRGMVPWIKERILLEGRRDGMGVEVEDGDGRRGGADGGRMVNGDGEAAAKRRKMLVNGSSGPVVNGINGHRHEPEVIDVDEDWGWQGAHKKDRKALDALLDDCLEF